MSDRVRLRQVVLTAWKRDPVARQLEELLGFKDGYNDPDVIAFGLENVVYATGDTFVEVVSPVQDNTAAGRTLDKQGEGGYMAIFQVPDIETVRQRVSEMDIRVVWHAELDDIAAMHLHPKDVGGAIVSIDQPEPPQSWRWAGPTWIGAEVPKQPGGVRGISVRDRDPTDLAARWGRILGLPVKQEDDRAALVLDEGRQCVRFVQLRDGEREGISEFFIASPDGPREMSIGGVTFSLVANDAGGA
jgi:hypothetical protein